MIRKIPGNPRGFFHGQTKSVSVMPSEGFCRAAALRSAQRFLDAAFGLARNDRSECRQRNGGIKGMPPYEARRRRSCAAALRSAQGFLDAAFGLARNDRGECGQRNGDIKGMPPYGARRTRSRAAALCSAQRFLHSFHSVEMTWAGIYYFCLRIAGCSQFVRN